MNKINKTGTNATPTYLWILALVFVLFANLANTLPENLLTVFGDTIMTQYSLTEGQYATFTSITGMCAIITVIPISLLIQRFTARKMAMVGLIVSACAYFMVLFAGTWGTVFTGRVIWQIGYRVINVTSIGMLLIVVPRSFRGRAQGINTSMVSISSLVGAPLTVLVANIVGRWQGSLYAYIIITALAFVGVFFFAKPYKEDNFSAPAAVEVKTEKVNIFQPIKVPQVWIMTLLLFIISTVAPVINYCAVVLAKQAPDAATAMFGSIPVAVATIMSVSCVIVTFVNPLVGIVSDKLGAFRTVMIMGALTIVCLLCLTSTSLTVVIIGMGLLIFTGVGTCNMVYAAAPKLVGKRADPSAYTAVITLGVGMSMLVDPFVLAWSANTYGNYNASFYVLSGLTVVGIIMAFALDKYTRRHVADVTAEAAIMEKAI